VGVEETQTLGGAGLAGRCRKAAYDTALRPKWIHKQVSEERGATHAAIRKSAPGPWPIHPLQILPAL